MKYLILLCLSWSIAVFPAHAQKGRKSKSAAPAADAIKKYTSKCIAFKGLFPLFQDTATGTTYLQVNQQQLNQEFIYFSHVVDGVSDAGLTRGAYRGSRIFSIRKYFDQLEFLGANTRYYFDPESPLSRAAQANINQPVLSSMKIVAQNDSAFLIKADGIFLSESFQQVKSSPRSSNRKTKRWGLGKLSKTKSRYRQVRNYPANTDVVVDLVYQEAYPARGSSQAITDPRVVSLRVQHSLIEVPDNDFEARLEDPRVGYFTSQITDMTSAEAAPFRDVIHRWDLQKKDPAAELSEPIQPIVWWIENTTPYELRPIIKAGVLRWNEAFEAVGFKNAVVVKEQPDDADWDAGDLRYNVLRWTSSPSPRFGGYGPSFVNPRTGQILGADIMLEYVYLTNRLRAEKLFEADAAASGEWDEASGHRCDHGLHLHHANLAGMAMLQVQENSDAQQSKFLKESIYRLVLHEVGHTLGLTHNFMASTLHSPEELQDEALTLETGLTGSVMEYPAINLPTEKSQKVQFFDVAPGPYDMWAIAYGYAPALADPEAEAQRMKTLLDRSIEPALAYGNDADDMRAPGKGIDPRRMIFDLSNDPVAYAVQRLTMVENTYPGLVDKYTTDESSYQALLNAYRVLSREQLVSLNVISRQLGGVHVNRAAPGQDSTAIPYQPVPAELQKRAMSELRQWAFAPDALQVPTSLYNMLQPQRRGFNHFRRSEDPRVHDRVLGIQKQVLNQLLHPNVLKRMTDSEAYGNTYELEQFMTDLTSAIFSDDLNREVNGFRQNLQVEYVIRLTKVLEMSTYHTAAKSMALFELNRIQSMVKRYPGADLGTKAHRKMIDFLIGQAFDPKP
ncbi:MAG: zinc-dependent metalloprotease [Salibacteraceae bacterium]